MSGLCSMQTVKDNTIGNLTGVSFLVAGLAVAELACKVTGFVKITALVLVAALFQAYASLSWKTSQNQIFKPKDIGSQEIEIRVSGTNYYHFFVNGTELSNEESEEFLATETGLVEGKEKKEVNHTKLKEGLEATRFEGSDTYFLTNKGGEKKLTSKNLIHIDYFYTNHLPFACAAQTAAHLCYAALAVVGVEMTVQYFAGFSLAEMARTQLVHYVPVATDWV